MAQQTRGYWLAVIALSVLLGACVTYTGFRSVRHADRGIRFGHPKHAEEGLDCTDCHEMAEGGQTMPGHDLCGICHDIDVDNPDAEACGFCHTEAEQAVRPRAKLLKAELKFSHGPHVGAELDCATCHPEPDARALPKKPLKSFCMDCHGETGPELNECDVCHSEVSKEVRPAYYGATRIPHDAPQIWERVHGRESTTDPAFCALCHETEASCEACHRKNPPRDHTLAWRRKSHGLRASWDRAKCSVCHEEDSCLKCHKNTKPSSHRGAWDRPLNRHCASCHYPPQKTNCTVCHESIDHSSALPSPHALGVFPRPCRLCHPGGLPHRAPHVLNSTVRCAVCH